MTKRMIRSVGIILITIIYCLIIHFFHVSLWDVELTFSTPDGISNGAVMQLFWDDGTGLSADNSAFMQIDQQVGSVTLTKGQIDQIISYRIDPIAEQKEITFSSVALNGQEIDFEEFLGWAVAYDQLQYEIRDSGSKKLLIISPTSADPQIYMGEQFTSAIKAATGISSKVRKKLMAVGVIIALILLLLREILWVFDKIAGASNKVLVRIFEGHKGRQHAAVIAGFLIVSILVFWKFVIRRKFFLFADASDQYGQFYPQLLEYARYIEKGLKYGSFDFSKALGDNVGLIKLNLNTWVCWFGKENVAYLLGISHFLKVFLSGLAFYAFMCVNGQKRWFSATLALGYAFCGHMTLRGSWGNYPNEVLLAAIWLLSFELLLKRRDFRWLPFATFLFFYHYSGGYYMYLYLAVFVGYAIFRIITEYKIPAKLWIGGIAVGVLGFGSLLVVTKGRFFNGIIEGLSSDRAQSILNEYDWNVSSFLPSMDNWPIIFGRTIGLATVGINGIDYTDQYWNSLEDPTFYCGILVLLLIPLAFYSMNWKKRVWYGLAFMVAFACCFIGPFRVILNGFSGGSYKLCTFWIIIVMLFTVGQIDWKKILEEKNKKIASGILVLTFIILTGLLINLKKQIYVSEKYYLYSMVFLVIECIAMLLMLLKPQIAAFAKTAIVVIVGMEVICVAYPIYNNRKTLDENIYWDDTMDALAFIAEEDDTFYRIDKQYQSVHYCDSLAQGYNGTSFYIGGTGPMSITADFYHDMGLPIYSLNRITWGTSSYNEVETLLGIRYILTKEQDVANYGFEKIGQTGEVSIYENKNALPLGFVYTKAIERSTFEALPYNQRQRALLMAMLVEDGTDVLPLLSEEELASLQIKEELFDQYEVPIQSAENYSFVFEPSKENEVILVQITFDGAGKSDLCYSSIDGHIYHMPIHQESEGQIFEINVADINRVWADSPNWANIMEIRVAKMPQSVYYESYDQIVDTMRNNGVTVLEADDNYFLGTFSNEADGVLFLPIIERRGWDILIDDEWQPELIINDTLSGIVVPKGKHKLEMTFANSNAIDAYRLEARWILSCCFIWGIGSWLNVRDKKNEKSNY